MVRGGVQILKSLLQYACSDIDLYVMHFYTQ